MPKASATTAKSPKPLRERLKEVAASADTIPPISPDNSIPDDARCQEASMFSKERYIPCGAPAVSIVFHDKDRRGYYMCAPCADHNVRNRGGRLVANRAPTMKERLAAVARSAAPSMVPDFTPPPPPKEPEVVPDVKAAIPVTADRLKLIRLVREYAEASEVERAARKAKEPITAQIKALLGLYEINRVMCDDRHVSYYATTRTSIMRDLLLAAGVQPDVIQRCTKTKAVYTLRIGLPDEKEENGE